MNNLAKNILVLILCGYIYLGVELLSHRAGGTCSALIDTVKQFSRCLCQFIDCQQQCMKVAVASLSALTIVYFNCFNHFGAHELFTND